MENFLDTDSLKKIFNTRVQKTDLRRYFYRSKNKFLIKKIIRLQIYDLLQFFELNKISKKLKMEEISSEILRKQSKLY